MGTGRPSFDPRSALGQLHEKTVVMNEAQILGSVRQHEFTEAAENLNARQVLEGTRGVKVRTALHGS
jgi:hypothetical protein